MRCSQVPVFVSGQLFYDSKHFINARSGLRGAENSRSGSARRNSTAWTP